MQRIHGNIPNLLDNWADPAVHLLKLNSSMALVSKVKIAVGIGISKSKNGLSFWPPPFALGKHSRVKKSSLWKFGRNPAKMTSPEREL